MQQNSKSRKAGVNTVEIALENVEKAELIPEILGTPGKWASGAAIGAGSSTTIQRCDRSGSGWSQKQTQESKKSMASALYQSIELLSREKGIEPEIVVGAVEEAIALATRKYYKTQENMRGELNKDTGEITAYILQDRCRQRG